MGMAGGDTGNYDTKDCGLIKKMVASDGHADDAALMSNDFRQLQHLMDLTTA